MTNRTTIPGTASAEVLARVRRVSRLMDSAIRVPGTKLRLGVDSIVGLAPIVGDIATAAISLWIVWQARKLGVSRGITAAMLGIVALDVIGGLVPVVGDVFDVAFKANEINLRLLDRALAASPRPSHPDSPHTPRSTRNSLPSFA